MEYKLIEQKNTLSINFTDIDPKIFSKINKIKDEVQVFSLSHTTIENIDFIKDFKKLEKIIFIRVNLNSFPEIVIDETKEKLDLEIISSQITNFNTNYLRCFKKLTIHESEFENEIVTLKNLPNLEDIEFTKMKKYKKIPKDFFPLTVKRLKLTETVETFDDIHEYPVLEYLDLSDTKIKSIKYFPESLKFLCLDKSKIEELPFDYQNLEQMRIWGCQNLKRLTSNTHLSATFIYLYAADTKLDMLPEFDAEERRIGIVLDKREDNIVLRNLSVRNRRIIEGRETIRREIQNYRILYNDDQNVHDINVNRQLSESLVNILKNEQQIPILKSEEVYEHLLENKKIKKENKCVVSSIWLSGVKLKSHDSLENYNTTYKNIFTHVYSRILAHKEKDSLFITLNEELESSRGVCFHGQCLRLVNALLGYYDDIKNEISEQDEIKGMIVAIYTKYKSNMETFKVKLYEELYNFFKQNKKPEDEEEDILKKTEDWCIMTEYMDGH